MTISRMQQPRQQYGLGSFVKKITRGAKKVFKSPLGKAALIAAGGYYLGGGSGFGGAKMFGNTGFGSSGIANYLRSGASNLFKRPGADGKGGGFLQGLIRKKGGDLSYGKMGLLGLGLAGTALPFMMGGEEEEEDNGLPFSSTPGNITDIVSQARAQDPSLRFLPQNRYVQKNFYTGANGGIVGLANGGGAGEQQMMQILKAEYIKYRQQGGTMPFKEFVQIIMQQQQQQQEAPQMDMAQMEQPQAPQMEQPQMAAQGGRIGYTGGGGVHDIFNQSDLNLLKANKYNPSEVATWKDAGKDLLNSLRTTGHAQGGRIGYEGGGYLQSPVITGVKPLDPNYSKAEGEVVNEDMQEVVSNPDPIAELNMLALEVFGRPYDQLNEREQESLMNFISQNPEEEVIDEQGTMVDERATAESGGSMRNYMAPSNPMAKSPIMAEEDIINMYRPGDNRQMAAEGGMMDLGGMEKDYRAEGGFVPLGGQEKADDVPARLSKNEFVFTADAVRNAGDGDIDEGSAVMQRMMDNLEQGGQISEDSQGMNPAQEMFDTSQQLNTRIA